MTLYTPRFTLSSFQESDWPFFLHLRSNESVMRYMAEIASQTQIRTLFDDRLHDSNAFIIRDGDNVVGDIGLRISQHNPHEADIGYAIAPAAQGRGIASEALQALCEYAFSQHNVAALNAWVLAENQGSVRVLEKSGFNRVQVLEGVYLLAGEYYDDWVYRREK
ncbi:GNAT family N-acetyltransferase [Enterobacter sp. Bisph1]|uniref:GNAT family N-acetyltransferase n=1 Tax=Enterobacter sp. Bisph1 TaxID=1274399 RepID=UPI00057BDDF2|nr:GNAT family N-acetyltransferase [Enterobacter sp. Bisph1]